MSRLFAASCVAAARACAWPGFRQALGWVCLLVALLLAQSLGQVHSIQHSGRAQGQASGASLPSGAQRAFGPGAQHLAMRRAAGAPALAVVLFSTHEDGSPDCQLYDQIGHDVATAGVCVCHVPALPVSRHVGLFAGEALARWTAPFEARGPPLTL